MTESGAEAKVRVPIAAVDAALGLDSSTMITQDDWFLGVAEYLEMHMSVVDDNGILWAEDWHRMNRFEGVGILSASVSLDSLGSAAGRFDLRFDGLFDALPEHQIIVIVTDVAGEASTTTAGVLTYEQTAVSIGETSRITVARDMMRLGFEHVVIGADHLLFLATLLLPAPLVVVGRRWQDGGGPWRTFRQVVHIITAFTVGHSATLMMSAAGLVVLNGRLVEALIAVSVGISALHAIRPLAKHGGELVALFFGLIHGLAFADILANLGVQGSSSIISLVAFNVGVELAQLLAAVLVFPSLFALSKTRFYADFRIVGAWLAFAAALGWLIERVGVAGNPFAGVEEAAIDHPWRVVGALTAAAGLGVLGESVLRRSTKEAGDLREIAQ